MPLVEEHPNYTYVVRRANATAAWINDLHITHSCVVTPEYMLHPWRPTQLSELEETDLQALFALNTELILLGTGANQIFPSASIQAQCFSRGIGLEIMTNQAAARTYSIVAAEQRRVALALFFAS